MKLTPPTKLTFWISVILGLLGLIGTFVSIPFVSAYAFWFVVVGFVLLVAGLLFKGF
jgi:membrane protein YdbS with pleckstrin-like domain